MILFKSSLKNGAKENNKLHLNITIIINIHIFFVAIKADDKRNRIFNKIVDLGSCALFTAKGQSL
jgi:hypothetical protein